MDEVTYESPLDKYKNKFKEISSSSLSIRSIGFIGQINLRFKKDNIEKIKNITKLNFSNSMDTYSCSGKWSTLCLGPDEWLLIGPLEEKNDLIAMFNSLDFQDNISCVDVSFNRIGINIEGEKVIEFIRSLSNIDKKYFDKFKFTQTIMAKSQIIFQSTNQFYSFNIFIRPSFSNFFAEVLIDQSRFLS